MPTTTNSSSVYPENWTLSKYQESATQRQLSMRQPCHVSHERDKQPSSRFWRFSQATFVCHFTQKAHEHQSLFGVPRAPDPLLPTHQPPHRVPHVQPSRKPVTASLRRYAGLSANNISSGRRRVQDESLISTQLIITYSPGNSRQLTVPVILSVDRNSNGNGTNWRHLSGLLFGSAAESGNRRDSSV
jgi:hypothetical protein